MKRILLIDGENFVHSVVRSLHKSQVIRMRSQLHRLDCKFLFSTISKEKFSDISYYTTKIQIKSAPNHLVTSLNNIRAWNAKWAPYLANQQINLIKAGTLKIRDSKQCPHCHQKTSILQEKGVDVRLAVDIMTRAGKGVEIFILSSDVDLISAIRAAQLRGAKVTYVAFKNARNRALLEVADNCIEIKDSVIAKAFKRVNT